VRPAIRNYDPQTARPLLDLEIAPVIRVIGIGSLF
jgi:hypothetical protein